MKIFIDTAKLDEIKQAHAYGVLDGVTTNPSLIKKAAQAQSGAFNMSSYITKILKEAAGLPVSLEVIGTNYADIVREGEHLYRKFNSVAKNVVIKVPINPALGVDDPTQFDGIRAIRYFSKKKIPVNCTLIFTPEQAWLAAKAGASYVSPFAGRVDDLIRSAQGMSFEKRAYFPSRGIESCYEDHCEPLSDEGIVSGVDLVAECVDILEHYQFSTQVLAASVRNHRQVRELMLAGAHVATLPLNVIEELVQHKKTYEGMNAFVSDVVDEYAEVVRGSTSARRASTSAGRKTKSTKKVKSVKKTRRRK